MIGVEKNYTPHAPNATTATRNEAILKIQPEGTAPAAHLQRTFTALASQKDALRERTGVYL